MNTVVEKKKTSSPKRSVCKNEPRDMFQDVTDRIITALEQGVAPWQKPWTSPDSGLGGFPVNAVTGRRYSGINVLLLWMASVDNGFVSNRWLTFQQALNTGGNVIKGEKGTYAAVYRPFEQVKTDDDGHVVYDEDGNEVMEFSYFASRCVLFNAVQCENLPDEMTRMPPLPVLPELDRLARAEELIAASTVNIIHRRQNRAFYQPSVDRITMPLMGQFHTTADYYSTVLHELIHATGHQSRLARVGITRSGGQFGDPVYAFEELIVRRRGANIGVNMIILDSWENPCEPDLPVPVINRLKFRKENGTIACQEKAQTAEAIVGRAGHRKMRMVKAKLPEPQSSEFYPRQRRSGGCNVVPCRYRDAIRPGLKKMVLPNIFDPASTVCPQSGGSKGRTGHLSASYLHICVTTGSPKWAQVLRPTWRQSCHTSQMPEVMLRTAIFGWMIGSERCRVTGPGISTDQVKGNSVCDSNLSTEGMC